LQHALDRRARVGVRAAVGLVHDGVHVHEHVIRYNERVTASVEKFQAAR
jgi:hypothetical protein